MVHFIADGMLGRVARWLRILGCDVKYLNDLSDEKLMEITRKDNRVLLTKDLELFRRARIQGLNAFYIVSETNPEKIAEVAKEYSLSLKVNTSISRCPNCGFQIEQVEKTKVLGRVSEGTFKHHSKFWLCVNCDKIYWKGSHWKKINETLEKAKELLERKREKSVS